MEKDFDYLVAFLPHFLAPWIVIQVAEVLTFSLCLHNYTKLLIMTANITFSKYSEDKELNDLYISNKIIDEYDMHNESSWATALLKIFSNLYD